MSERLNNETYYTGEGKNPDDLDGVDYAGGGWNEMGGHIDAVHGESVVEAHEALSQEVLEQLTEIDVTLGEITDAINSARNKIGALTEKDKAQLHTTSLGDVSGGAAPSSNPDFVGASQTEARDADAATDTAAPGEAVNQ